MYVDRADINVGTCDVRNSESPAKKWGFQDKESLGDVPVVTVRTLQAGVQSWANLTPDLFELPKQSKGYLVPWSPGVLNGEGGESTVGHFQG